ncbi:rab GTPase-binding effector 1-like [Brachionus plicatilis]|uniref:Rab GTPase-binding effector 1-like n=1 Tax=Brachionus plicatilis TaxID=10195 RepID=A0A3M7QZG1_BRAPC|nr:rab GTPase-binding effector 1-like [Brachionus plicatilis]
MSVDEVNSESIASLIDEENDPVYLKNNQLDDMRTKITIIETTKQDELDELNFRHKQEQDSLNHIINALQSDLNTIRHEYESMNSNFKEYKRQFHHLNNIEPKSPISNSSSITHRLNLSPFGSKNNQISINQENENLEEDMRKAKESAEMLRSVVLPLETEISTLRSRSNTSEKRIKELEKIIDQQDKEKQKFIEEEQKLVQESLNVPVENDIESLKNIQDQISDSNSIQSDPNLTYFKKYIKLKKHLQNNEKKFIELEQTNLKALKQIFSILTPEQKIRLIPKRAKSKSILSSISKENSAKSSEESEPVEDNSDTSSIYEQNETILKIKELLDFLTFEQDRSTEDIKSIDTISSNDLSIANNDIVNSNKTAGTNYASYSYVELLALYENEFKYRTEYIKSNFEIPSAESKKQIEDLNREITNLILTIEEIKKEYSDLQSQCSNQIDNLIKINQDIQNEAKQIQLKNEQYKQENYRLKVENKQFYGEQSILEREIDDQFQPCSTIEDAQRQNLILKQRLAKLLQVNQTLQKQHALSLENIKNLQKINLQYQHSNSTQENMVIAQSLQSELDRERRVRESAEKDTEELKSQIISIKEKGQNLVESLKQRCEQNENEIRKLKKDNQELQNQIVTFKKDVQNSMSVQEDLVGLIQSLQIELNQTKFSNSSANNGPIEVRCQHEDDFNECAACKNGFTVTRRKHRCKHCCKIFCAECCSKVVLSGPNLRQHKVCNTCHILLDKDGSNSNTNQDK